MLPLGNLLLLNLHIIPFALLQLCLLSVFISLQDKNLPFFLFLDVLILLYLAYNLLDILQLIFISHLNFVIVLVILSLLVLETELQVQFRIALDPVSFLQ